MLRPGHGGMETLKEVVYARLKAVTLEFVSQLGGVSLILIFFIYSNKMLPFNVRYSRGE